MPDARNPFEIAGGTIPGLDHLGRNQLLLGKNNQDAYYFSTDPSGAIVAVICDGCSKKPHSEVGAKLACKILGEAILRNHMDDAWLSRAQDDMLAQLRVLALVMGGSFTEAVQDYFLFTTIGLFIRNEDVFIFGAGDGVYAVNDVITELEPEEGNKPKYIAYRMLQMVDSRMQDVELEVWQSLDVSEVDSLMIGSDGVSDLLAAAESCLPGTDKMIGPLSQFWENDQFFKNRDAIRRRLALANSTKHLLEGDPGRISTKHGLLRDDTTVVCARRVKPE